MKTNKVIILSACSLLVVVVAAAGSFWFLRSEKKSQLKDFSGQTPEQIRAYLRSKDFNSLDNQTRRMVGRTARIEMMECRVNEYFNLPEDKRTVYLDKLIDEMQARRAEFRAQRPDANDPNDRRRQRRQFARGAEDQRARMESVDPLTRAKRAAFRDAMRARMQQRGINGPGGGGGSRSRG
jgi:hypothetical protein